MAIGFEIETHSQNITETVNQANSKLLTTATYDLIYRL